MELTRRGFMALGAGAAALVLLPIRPAHASVEDAIAEFTGGAEIGEGGITLTTPEMCSPILPTGFLTRLRHRSKLRWQTNGGGGRTATDCAAFQTATFPASATFRAQSQISRLSWELWTR